MNGRSLLLWGERGLLAAGVVLAAWCAVALLEARFARTRPAPPPVTVTQTVVGETDRPSAAPTRGTLLARLTMPSLDLATTVLEGTDDGTLRHGAGHIEDTPFPGQPGNVGIAAHRDTIFRPLRRVQVGAPLELTTADRIYHYRVTKTLIVNPEDVYVLDPTSLPTITLVTCYPFEFIGHAPRRFIVHAELVGEESRTIH